MGNCFACIETSNKGIVTQCGKYDRIAEAGCMFLNPFACENVAGLVSLKIQEVGVQAETKTKDNGASAPMAHDRRERRTPRRFAAVLVVGMHIP